MPKTYTGETIAIAFDMKRCIHSRNCYLKLPQVFDPDRRPWVDPDAARLVFRSGLPIEMVGWELCRGPATLSEEEMRTVRDYGTERAAFAVDCNTRALAAARLQSNEPGLPLPDPVAMAIAIDPAICTRRSTHYVDVEVDSDLTRGMTVVDQLGVADDERNAGLWAPVIDAGRTVEVCWEIDVPAWKELLHAALR